MTHFKKQQSIQFKPLEEVDLSKIPEPITWHFLVQPYVPEDKTTGGFHITDSDNEDYKKLHCIGKVIKMGPLCFKAEAFQNTRPFEVNDVVFFNRHNGMWLQYDDKDFVLLADDRISMRLKEENLVNFDGFTKHKGVYED